MAAALAWFSFCPPEWAVGTFATWAAPTSSSGYGSLTFAPASGRLLPSPPTPTPVSLGNACLSFRSELTSPRRPSGTLRQGQGPLLSFLIIHLPESTDFQCDE